MCERMGKLIVANVVDHIVPVRVDPTRRLDPSNLQSLCTSHHSSAKQQIERRAPSSAYENTRYGRPGVGPDFRPKDADRAGSSTRDGTGFFYSVSDENGGR